MNNPVSKAVGVSIKWEGCREALNSSALSLRAEGGLASLGKTCNYVINNSAITMSSRKLMLLHHHPNSWHFLVFKCLRLTRIIFFLMCCSVCVINNGN